MMTGGAAAADARAPGPARAARGAAAAGPDTTGTPTANPARDVTTPAAHHRPRRIRPPSTPAARPCAARACPEQPETVQCGSRRAGWGYHHRAFLCIRNDVPILSLNGNARDL